MKTGFVINIDIDKIAIRVKRCSTSGVNAPQAKFQTIDKQGDIEDEDTLEVKDNELEMMTFIFL